MNILYDINTEFILNFCFNNEQACSTTAALFWHFWEAHLLLKWKNIGKQEIHQRCSLWYNKSIHFWVFCWNTRPLNKPNWHEKEKTELQSKRSFSSKSLVKKREAISRWRWWQGMEKVYQFPQTATPCIWVAQVT